VSCDTAGESHRKEPFVRSIISTLAVAGLALALSACGHNVEQRAATGAAAGLVIAGPVGAAVGAGVGVVVSKSSKDK
jgi:hypothetical protein